MQLIGITQATTTAIQKEALEDFCRKELTEGQLSPNSFSVSCLEILIHQPVEIMKLLSTMRKTMALIRRETAASPSRSSYIEHLDDFMRDNSQMKAEVQMKNSLFEITYISSSPDDPENKLKSRCYYHREIESIIKDILNHPSSDGNAKHLADVLVKMPTAIDFFKTIGLSPCLTMQARHSAARDTLAPFIKLISSHALDADPLPYDQKSHELYRLQCVISVTLLSLLIFSQYSPKEAAPILMVPAITLGIPFFSIPAFQQLASHQYDKQTAENDQRNAIQYSQPTQPKRYEIAQAAQYHLKKMRAEPPLSEMV